MNEPAMAIWHMGASHSIELVNGVNVVVWSIARSQARLGHQVTVILASKPDDATLKISQNEGLRLFVAPPASWPLSLGNLGELLRTDRPDLVHMHSVFIPLQAALAKALAAAGVPYVVTPHGGLSKAVMGRGKLKKTVYGALFEKRRFNRAAAVTALTPQEAHDIHRFNFSYKGPVPCVFNPVEVKADAGLEGRLELSAPSRATIVFLGRLDVLHKGLDRLVEIARFHPEADYHLYGPRDAKSVRWLDEIKLHQPTNVHFHPPVFGAEKVNVLNGTDLYIQASRWEGFALSVAEAMALGVPCAISETLGMTEMFRTNGLGMILARQPEQAAAEIRRLLADRPALLSLGRRGQEFARENFSLSSVTDSYLTIYRHAVRTTSARCNA